MTDKQCPKCSRVLEAERFSIDRGRPSGRQPYCRECQAHIRRERVRTFWEVADRRACGKCGVEKAASEFHLSRGNRDGLATNCKECVKERGARWRRENPERIQRNNLRHGTMTPETYQALLAQQGGACAVCRSSEPGGRGRFHVDHDHSCCPGSRGCDSCIRGLLCHRCNTALGLLGDDADRLRAAIDYLAGARVSH